MVYLKTVKIGDKTYYYICKSYNNKFGKKYQRIILAIKQHQLLNIEGLLLDAQGTVTLLDYYENLFEMFLSKYGKIKGKNEFINHLVIEKRFEKTRAEKRWEMCVASYEKITQTKLYASTKTPEPKKRGRITLPEGRKAKKIHAGVPTGTVRTLKAIVLKLPKPDYIPNGDTDKRYLATKTHALREAIKWTVEAIHKYDIEPTDLQLIMHTPKTMEVVAKIPIYRRYGHTRLYRSFRLYRDEIKGLRTIQQEFKLLSINSAIIHAISFYGKWLGVWKAYFCLHDNISTEKKYGKYLPRVKCAKDLKKYRPDWCLTCKDWR